MNFDRETMLGAQAAFGLAAQLVQREPDEEWARLCIEEKLFDACPFGEEDQAVADGLSLLSAWCENARGNIAQNLAAVRREWLRLLVGLGAPEAPVWESVYTEPNSTMFGQATLDVRAVYKEWGLQLEHKGQEPDNSLGIMLAFCSHLMGRWSEAMEEQEFAAASKASESLEDFLVQHMLPWVSAWRFLVKQHAKTDYYRGVGELVFGLERACAARFGIVFNEETGAFSYARS